MGAKWFWGIIILAIASLLWSLFTAPNRSASMGEDIRSALNSAGYTTTKVDMSGNVATLTGEVASDATANEIITTAKNAKCSKCAGKKTWHEVKNNLTVKKAPALPTQSPYTFEATKSEDGNVLVNGYVRNEQGRQRVLAKANALFPGKVTDNTVRIAKGEPNADWENVIDAYFDELNVLDNGRFVVEDTTSYITGQAGSADIRDGVNQGIDGLPSSYKGDVRLTIPAEQAVNVCQDLLNDVKKGKKINFAYDRAEVRGAESFDLLNALAATAKECGDVSITVEGHTDADGSEVYNQRLSEARANTVVAYLSQNGTDINRMTAIGYGETKPIGDNTTSAGKAQNRRIEFIVTQSE